MAEKAIAGLLDLVEKFGSESAGPRLMEKEAEKAQLVVEVRQLELQKQSQRLTVSPDEVEGLLKEMRSDLASEDAHARRVVISKIVNRVEMGATGGKILYSFPVLELTGIWKLPQGNSNSCRR